jgi:hypothetical protein
VSTTMRHAKKRLERESQRELERVCRAAGGKVRFRKRKQALTAMNEQRGYAARAGRSMPNGVYRCASCGDWHMTSKARA